MSIQDVDSRAEAGAGRRSRRSFLRRAAVAAPVAGAAALMAPREAQAQTGAEFDVRELSLNFRSIQRHENAHVEYFKLALGSAYPQAQFVNLSQPNFKAFRNVAAVLENTGAQTYLGAVPLIAIPAYLAQAGAIALVEARHAGWVNTTLGGTTTSHIDDTAYETTLTPLETARLIAPYLADPSAGLALASAISTTPSPSNDLAILRFAAVLEQLEAAYYNINVPRIFRGL